MAHRLQSHIRHRVRLKVNAVETCKISTQQCEAMRNFIGAEYLLGGIISRDAYGGDRKDEALSTGLTVSVDAVHPLWKADD
jgi:hypothetical protein